MKGIDAKLHPLECTQEISVVAVDTDVQRTLNQSIPDFRPGIQLGDRTFPLKLHLLYLGGL